MVFFSPVSTWLKGIWAFSTFNFLPPLCFEAARVEYSVPLFSSLPVAPEYTISRLPLELFLDTHGEFGLGPL